ncbi:4-alpha-glucanotransferase [Roseivivax isoporae]|uniref:4-alpha-glucanotransferase n=1 Tax=Roseivivax isoporae LMG 25204 TaxID=1449351 RepID=X7F779_9RHOB|nr:4-alpha-glucanotransferase [Roseivivax isoporae]ETX28787.1 4-alpha-glucanotransferase [Roseivivax isoporae LMG 25204]
MADALARLADRAGILPAYTDVTGTHRETSHETRAALLAAMGLPHTEVAAAEYVAALPERALPEWIVAEAGTAPDLAPAGPWRLTAEDGTETEGTGPLPALPLGRHRLQAGDETCWILAAPARLPLPDRGWGLIVPLYGLRTAAEGGIGTYDDLARLAEGLGRQGADFVGLNPVHAGFPTDAGAVSPYTPSHRRRLSTLHITTGLETGSAGPLIDYASEIPAHNARLEAMHAAFEDAGGDPDLDAWIAREGTPLRRFALYQALSERHGTHWDAWPADLQDPDSPAALAAEADLGPRLRFHMWAQWEAERQLRRAQDRARAAGMAQGLYLDLAVGTHPHGAETWEDRASFAFGASLGAPPDAFSADGQNWNLAPFNPARLAETGFAALAETLARQLQLSGLLRIDHILGFERAFWVPQDGAPGAYVAMPREAMLAVARIEASRVGAAIIGEDLGNIPDGLHHALDAAGILGCRVMMFERHWSEGGAFRAPEAYSEAAIASFSTHDLPTWAGWRAGSEIRARARLDHLTPEDEAQALQERAAEVAALDRATAACSDDEAGSARRMHAMLARAGSRLVAVQVENVLDMAEQPNLPGTVYEYPNWRRRLTEGVDALPDDPRLARTAEIMRANGR